MHPPLLVLKFGGTSLATPARLRRAAYRIRAHLSHDTQVVVVASALGHTTDRILSRIDQLRIPTGVARREIDRALATGETLSSALLAAGIRARGFPARSLSGGEAGIEANGDFGFGVITRVNPSPIRRLLRNRVVPVVAGFQGRRPDGETITLGRGSSDGTAVALAAALGPVPCHIVTDVAAVCDRDPNLDPTAKPYSELSHAELLRIAEDGAQVVHPGAARLALDHRVPLCIYDYRSPLGGVNGTAVGSGEARS